MAISGLQVINIGLQNESTGSDSLYTAFNKTKDNFATLANIASPYNTFTGNGVTITANATAGTVNINNAGVTNVSLTSNNLTVTGSPLTTTGTLTVDLPANVPVTGQLLLNGNQNLTNSSAVNVFACFDIVSTSYVVFCMSLVCFLSFKIPTSIKYYLSNTFSFHKSTRYAV